MMALTEVISNTTGKAPWSIGSESGMATGWPLTDWFEDILLRSAGPGIYDDLVAHNIPWTHTEVISAANIFAGLFGNQQYQLGGKGGTLYTSFIDAMYPPFNDPPEAYLHRQGSFTQSFLATQFPAQTAGVDYAVFPFPDIQPAYTNAVMGGGDVATIYHNTPEAQALINYLITTEAAEIWIAEGNMSPNRSVDPNLYPDPNTRFAAERLANASLFRSDLTDQLPSRLNEYVWSQMDDLVQAAPDPAAMEAVLEDIEFIASHPYWTYAPLMVFNSDW
jgi:alpha-glucoside transport system substrate-binding protein